MTKVDKKHLSSCTRCNYCRWVPVPKSDTFSYICPSIQYGARFGYTGGGKMMLGYGLSEGEFEYSPEVVDTIYSCTMCGACDVACKTNLSDLIEPLDALYEVRRLCAESGNIPAPLTETLAHLKTHGNTAGLPASERERWAEGLDVARLGDGAKAQTLLLVGDAAFDSTQWDGLRFALAAIQSAGESVMIAGAAEPDCGALAFDIGDQALARSLAQATLDMIRSSGAARVITCSDTAYMAFRAIYPRLGLDPGGIDVLHITQWLAKHVSGASGGAERTITYHDSCRLGRLSEKVVPWKGEWKVAINTLPLRDPEPVVRFGNDGVYDEPRALLEASGARIVEMERTREYAYCCGAGGGASQANPKFARAAGLERLKEAAATGADVMVTSCGGCSGHMNRLADEASLPIRVVGLLDYLRQSKEGEAQ